MEADCPPQKGHKICPSRHETAGTGNLIVAYMFLWVSQPKYSALYYRQIPVTECVTQTSSGFYAKYKNNNLLDIHQPLFNLHATLGHRIWAEPEKVQNKITAFPSQKNKVYKNKEEGKAGIKYVILKTYLFCLKCGTSGLLLLDSRMLMYSSWPDMTYIWNI